MICETEAGRWRGHRYDQAGPEGRCRRCGISRQEARSISRATSNARRRSIRKELLGMRHLHDEAGEVSDNEGLWVAVILMAAADAQIRPSGRFKMTEEFARTARDFWADGTYKGVLAMLGLDPEGCDDVLIESFPWLAPLLGRAETAA